MMLSCLPRVNPAPRRGNVNVAYVGQNLSSLCYDARTEGVCGGLYPQGVQRNRTINDLENQKRLSKVLVNLY